MSVGFFEIMLYIISFVLIELFVKILRSNTMKRFWTFMLISLLSTTFAFAELIEHPFLPDGCRYENGNIIYPDNYNLDKIKDDQVYSDDYKYVIFNNLDTDFYESAYYKYMKENPEYAQYSVALPFNDNTFSQYNITDFDLAIFVLGDAPLNAQMGTTVVYEKINEMIEGGKNVLITGRKMLWYALDEQAPEIFKNEDVIDMLENTLGIEYIKDLNVHKVEGNTTTWWGYIIRGHFGDPIGRSIHKYCNMNFDTGNEIWEPLAHYFSVNVFKSRDKQKYPEVDHFIRGNNDERNDTIVGIRTEIDQARVALWSMGFEAFAGDIPRETLLQRAMMWLLGNIAPDGAQILVEPYSTNFGSVPVGQTSERSFSINSIGKEPLEITDISFFFNDDDSFEVTEGAPEEGSPIVIQPGEYHEIKVAFTPQSQKRFQGLLTIYSNALNGQYKDVNIEGVGGESEQGPVLETNADENGELDFGSINTASSKEIDLEIRNVGDAQLRVDDIEIIDDDDNAFLFPYTLETPFFVPEGEVHTITVRFVGLQEEKEYTATIKIQSDAQGSSDYFVYLKGSVDNSIGVKDNTVYGENFEVKIIPNPASDEIRIEYNYSGEKALNADIYIADINGKRLMEIGKKMFNYGINSEAISVEQLPSGSYLIIFDTDSERISYPLKIIK
jgi:hypothetical protein